MIMMSCKQELFDLRYNLILQAAKEKDRNLRDLRKNVLAWPVLVAKGSQILGGRKCTGSLVRSKRRMTHTWISPRNKLLYCREGVLQDQTPDVFCFLILRD